MIAGDLYIADEPELAEHNLRALDLMHAYNATSPRDADEQRRLLTELFGAIGDGTEIRPRLYVDYGKHIRIGARTFANCAASDPPGAARLLGDLADIARFASRGPNTRRRRARRALPGWDGQHSRGGPARRDASGRAARGDDH